MGKASAARSKEPWRVCLPGTGAALGSPRPVHGLQQRGHADPKLWGFALALPQPPPPPQGLDGGGVPPHGSGAVLQALVARRWSLDGLQGEKPTRLPIYTGSPRTRSPKYCSSRELWGAPPTSGTYVPPAGALLKGAQGEFLFCAVPSSCLHAERLQDARWGRCRSPALFSSIMPKPHCDECFERWLTCKPIPKLFLERWEAVPAPRFCSKGAACGTRQVEVDVATLTSGGRSLSVQG